MSFVAGPDPLQDGPSSPKTVLVTGSTDGLGRRIVERLAGPGVHLIVHGRDQTRGAEVVDFVKRAGGAASFCRADLSSLNDVRVLATAVLDQVGELSVLVNNAGVAQMREPRRTSLDGHELHLAVNYLAPALLTALLKPLLHGTERSQVVNVTSVTQNRIEFHDVMLQRVYDGYRAYGQSKLASVMLTFDLANAWNDEQVAVNCVHPATHMDTKPVRKAGIKPWTSVDTGAQAVVALIEETDSNRQTGLYFNNGRSAAANAQAYDMDARRKLRDLTTNVLSPYL